MASYCLIVSRLRVRYGYIRFKWLFFWCERKTCQHICFCRVAYVPPSAGQCVAECALDRCVFWQRCSVYFKSSIFNRYIGKKMKIKYFSQEVNSPKFGTYILYIFFAICLYVLRFLYESSHLTAEIVPSLWLFSVIFNSFMRIPCTLWSLNFSTLNFKLLVTQL